MTPLVWHSSHKHLVICWIESHQYFGWVQIVLSICFGGPKWDACKRCLYYNSSITHWTWSFLKMHDFGLSILTPNLGLQWVWLGLGHIHFLGNQVGTQSTPDPFVNLIGNANVIPKFRGEVKVRLVIGVLNYNELDWVG